MARRSIISFGSRSPESDLRRQLFRDFLEHRAGRIICIGDEALGSRYFVGPRDAGAGLVLCLTGCGGGLRRVPETGATLDGTVTYGHEKVLVAMIIVAADTGAQGFISCSLR